MFKEFCVKTSLKQTTYTAQNWMILQLGWALFSFHVNLKNLGRLHIIEFTASSSLVGLLLTLRDIFQNITTSVSSMTEATSVLPCALAHLVTKNYGCTTDVCARVCEYRHVLMSTVWIQHDLLIRHWWLVTLTICSEFSSHRRVSMASFDA